MSTYRTSGNARPHIVAIDRGRTRNDGCKFISNEPQTRREKLLWCALFIAITAAGIGLSLYFTEPPVASDASASVFNSPSAFEASAAGQGAAR